MSDQLERQVAAAQAMNPNEPDVTLPVGRCVGAVRVLNMAIEGKVTAQTAIEAAVMILTTELKDG